MEKPIAIVTGAQQGIGLAIAQVLSSRGFYMVLCDLDERALSVAAETIGDSSAYTVDVSDFEAVERVVAQVETGLGAISVLVNNAGINRDRMLHRMSRDEWDRVVAVDLTGPFNFMRHVVPRMRERRSGRVINISSASWQGNVGQAN